MAGIPLLVLRIEGPMQSWGLRARWDVRDTGTEPSKSGIVGLLGCALGYHRDDPRLETELDALLRIGVRVERPGKIARDYQTITPEEGTTFPTASGKPNNTVKTIVSPREYIEDAAFIVVIDGPRELLQKCHDALLDPAWPIYLGRKSCPPTRPVLDGFTDVYESIDDALRRYPWHDDSCVATPSRLRCIMDDVPGTASDPVATISTRQDATRVNLFHEHATRRVRLFTVNVPEISRGDEDVPLATIP